MAQHRELKNEGESDYDVHNDVLFFKVKDREYAKSMEFEHFVLDIDEEKFIVGMQIFDASEFFKIPKQMLRNVQQWNFQAKIEQNLLEVRLVFQMLHRNKIIEPRPIIIEQLKEPLPDSNVTCSVN